MAAPSKPQKKCNTVIPASWPKLTGPAWHPNMTIDEANRLWAGFLRVQATVRPTPRVYRSSVE